MVNDAELAYAEVDAILNLLEKEYVEKVPKKIRDFFKDEKDKNYIPKISKDFLELEDMKLKRETVCLLTLLEINYWCETEEERQSILNKLKENDKIKEKELRERYNPDNIFNNVKNKEIKENVAIIEYKEKTIIKKILDKILSMFKKSIR